MLWTVLLLLTVGVEAQSGDTGEDVESRISCNSHISAELNSLTCQLLPGRHGDEDDEDDEEENGIERMTLCSDWRDGERRVTCEKDHGNPLHFTDAPVVNFTLTVDLKRGRPIQTTLDLKKIVKPKPPQVWNVTFNQGSNEAVIHIQDPYHKDYLTNNQMFQVHIWTTATHMLQNLSSDTWLKINMEHLRANSKYQVEVRGLPVKFLEGSWSEWSHTYSFVTPAERQNMDTWFVSYIPLLCLVPLVVLVVIVVFLWKKKCSTYDWLSIPHPKDTLVHICKPHKALLLNLNPEVFSALKVTPMMQRHEPPQPSSAHGAQPDPPEPPASTQSSDCRSATSASTEELELSSALLSAGSSDAEPGLHSRRPSPVHQLGGEAEVSGGGDEVSGGGDEVSEGGVEPGAEVSEGGVEPGAVVSGGGAGQQEEAYVTMSSFYQV